MVALVLPYYGPQAMSEHSTTAMSCRTEDFSSFPAAIPCRIGDFSNWPAAGDLRLK